LYKEVDEIKVWIKTFLVILVAVTAVLLIPSRSFAAPVLKEGSRGEEVALLQQKLKVLGYFNYPEITSYYGTVTKESVKKFQKDNNLFADGIVGPDTYSALDSKWSQVQNALNSKSTLRKGDKGAAVLSLQKLLNAKGFFNGDFDGVFGSNTESAVKSLQAAYGLKVDGIVGNQTKRLLLDSTISRSSSTGTGVELLSWSEGDKLFPRKSTAKLYDVDTGLSFNIYRLGGTWHADVEPLTAEDTAIMKKIYGGSWSWSRRAVILIVGERKIAASMNGMPHGQQDIYGNNFDGQFCVHLLGSKIHKSGNVDPDHQAMVKKAAQARY